MEPQAHVYVAITAVRAALSVDGIQKSRTNQGQNYKFRGIDDVFNSITSKLAENGLCVMPSYSERQQVERVSDKGKPIFYTSVRGAFAFVSQVDGSSHTVVTYGEAMDSADKSSNKAMSAAMKYALLQTFTIPTDAENDADAVTHEVAKFTKAEQDTLAELNTAAADGSKSLKAAWQKLSVEQRERFRGELESLKTTAAKNDPAPAKTVEPAKTEPEAAAA